MHRAQIYFDNFILPANFGVQWAGLALNPATAGNFQNELYKDSWSYLYSAAVSIADAVKGIENELFSWATVKLYYATFYSLRAHLAASSYAILYQKTLHKATPYGLSSFPNESPKKLSGNTHKVVLMEFARIFDKALVVSQQINGEKPLNWMMDRREEANYKNGCFPEPNKPSHFNGVSGSPIRATLNAYINDDGLTYGFDPDHAILALPILTFRKALETLKAVNAGGGFSEAQADFLKVLFRDKNGPIPSATSLFT
jgi:uncharacterized protein (UPF0332 family)